MRRQTHTKAKAEAPSLTESFYQKNKWKAFSKKYKLLNPFCRSCASINRVALAKVTDHIIAIKNGGAKFDLRNLQPLCRECDTTKRIQERDGKFITPMVKNNLGEWIPGGEV